MNMFTKIKDIFIPRNKLSNATVAGLIGHTNVVYYNFQKGSWNANKYNGYKIYGQGTDTKEAWSFKAVMDQEPQFCAQYEMAAIVVMTIDSKFFPGWKKTIGKPVYSNNGTAVVGNIIVKNQTTGKYELFCKSWVGAFDYHDMYEAVTQGASLFTLYSIKNSDFRRALIDAHTL